MRNLLVDDLDIMELDDAAALGHSLSYSNQGLFNEQDWHQRTYTFAQDVPAHVFSIESLWS